MKLPRTIWAFAATKVLFHLATTRLSFHRDELYFISASKRLDWSYVDFQPITPLLVRIEQAIGGDSVLALRVIPALAGAGVVVLGALIARELGGNRRTQILAAFAMLIAPMFVGANSALNTVTLEIPAFMLVALVFARLLRTNDPRWWPALGSVAGLALLVKFTAVAYLGGIAIAALATPLRRHITTAWFWLGALITVALVTPSVMWQARNDWAVLEFIDNQGGGGAVLGLRGRLGYLAGLIILPGIVAVFMYVPGLIGLLRNRVMRPLGIAVAISIAGFLIASGKGYYAFPGIAVLLCAGAVYLMRDRESYPRALMIGIGFSLLVSLPLVVPLVPLSVLRDNADISDATEMGERLGWDDIARTVDGIRDDLPDADQRRAVVLGDNYTLPSAIEFYGADHGGLPPAMSGHNSAYLWWPRIEADHVAIAIGFSRSELDDLYDDVERVATVRNRFGIDNYEWGKPIWVARGPKLSQSELRERIKTFEA